MAFSFDLTLPSTRDRIRLMLGDTVAPGLRQDETIDQMLIAFGEAEATARLAEGLAAQYAQRVDSFHSSTGMSVSWRDRVSTWLELAKRLRSQSGGGPLGSASRAASRGDESVAEYLRPASWVWGDPPGGPW
jgi:hypothetical protein